LTASSSEILALALKEKINATIVGTQTFWKGSIQTLYDFKDGTSLKYTIGKWFSPSWVTIDHEGIVPDVEEIIDITGYIENGFDSQLQKAQEVLVKILAK
jgi:carboxyl-terminal processing protease